ncbi:MAG: hypothetical protein QF692_06610 [Alphaproteobacteria bacterium]|jgi:hypothetical protein|nr:hypothetical protein [Alphaproteobacteria bacterium]MDP7222917.1 hypothetical protein [Alphaproteobacteria bacterium]
MAELEANTSLLWQKYRHQIDTNRGYIDIVIKLNLFYYAITGSILSFYFASASDAQLFRYVLLFPIVMSLCFAFISFGGARSAKVSQRELRSLASTLDFESHSVVANILKNILYVSSVLTFIVAIAMMVLFFTGVR